MAIIFANNLTYHLFRRGSGQPLLLLHGFSGSSESWINFAIDLSTQREVIAIDLLGHGKSEKPQTPDRYAIDRAADDIITITKQLGLARFGLLGYSMGGRLALYLSLNYPEKIKALVLESASPGIASKVERDQRLEWDYNLADSIEQEGIRKFVDYWEQIPLFASQMAVPEYRRIKLREQRLQNNTVGLANSLRGMGTGSQPSLWALLPGLAIPTLLISGELDKKYVQINQEMARSMPKAEHLVVQNAGHNVHFEKPKIFTEIVSNFLFQIRAINS
jgi:2-succinyl-6-hydroxy-2,4-cyclohexadiene-1-carboxylate synthase